MAEKNEMIISDIKWDRIWIYFTIENVPSDCNIYLRRFPSEKAADYSASLLPVNETPGLYKLNITNPGNSEMLPVGVYFLECTEKDDLSNNTRITETSIPEIKYKNRKFVYFHSERAYCVRFTDRNGFKIKTSDGELEGLTFFRKLSSRIRKARHDLAKSILRLIYNTEYILFHRHCRKKITINKTTVGEDIFQLKNPKILLMSDQSEEMGSNMAALKKALIKEGYSPREALRAITTKHYSIFHWIKTLKKIAEADFIFLDDHSQTTDWLTIKGAVITQLWHAGAGFKSTGYSRFGMPASPAPKSGHRQYTYGIAGSKKIRHFFSEVWGINDDQVLPAGMPRLDEYLDENYRNETKLMLLNKYPALCKPDSSTNIQDKPQKRDHIILFAPTYRGENKRHAYYPYDKLDFDKLYELCKLSDSFIIFKMHPFVSEPVPIPDKYRDRMLDMTSYPNINDLFYITDLLITDYSSNIYEFSLMRKPILFYAFDIDEYTKERGFHRDYRTNVPGKIAETFDDMINAIKANDYEYEKVEEYINTNFEYLDSHACDRIIDWIIRGNLTI